MKRSELMQKDHEDLIALYKRMKPEERLMAYFHHSQLLSQLRQAGMNYRSNLPRRSRKISPDQ